MNLIVRKKLNNLDKVPFKEYYDSRLAFIIWAREQKYTLEEIGQWLGMTKNGVRGAIIRSLDKVHMGV